ncbi:MAG: acetyl-CoA hydrolase/transferase C-terminal domain-containing protein [Amaricoccus sp.]|uniref:acetyl-CoA hydrolase/transferase family protein n=1 Tax=Amaricoccus sp. TaxID=1872485 RepID=UPI0039E66F4B
MTLPDLSGLIRPGDTILWGQSHAEPLTLIGALIAHREKIGRTRLFLGIGLSSLVQPQHADYFDLVAYCGSGTNRDLAKAGVLDILPVHYSHLPALIRSGALKIDVVMLQVPPPDELGRYSLGMAREYVTTAVEHARVVLAEVQRDAPWTFGGPYLRESDFDLIVQSDAAMPGSAPARIGPVEEAIGRNVGNFVEDGATLQTGVGAIPDAVLSALHDRRDLGVHTGSFGDGMAALCASGAVTNSFKPMDRGISTCGILIGGEPARRFAHRNPELVMHGTDHTHDRNVLAAQHRFVAINSAIEVDLTGQVNSEQAGGRYLGGVGGIDDFLRGAINSAGGVPVVALPSTSGRRSRIVSRLSGPTTVARSDGCVVVTEHGAADLRGLGVAARTRAMIAIAHPDHREQLERELAEGLQ